jgi:hypothetical protein
VYGFLLSDMFRMKRCVSCDMTPCSAFVVETGIHKGLTSCQDLPKCSLNLDLMKESKGFDQLHIAKRNL